MKRQGKWLLLSGLLALVTSYALLQLLKSNGSHEVKGTAKVQVVVATADIQEHTYLETNMFVLKEVSQDSAPQDAVHSLADLKNSLSRQHLVVGETLQTSMLLKSNQSDSLLAMKVPKGMRAVSISNNAVIGLNGMLAPGDRVDLIAAYKKDTLNSKQDTVKILLQDLEILAVGVKKNNEASSGSKDGKQSQGSLDTQQTTLTLAVSPAQSESLVFADLFGTIRLALRGPGDDGKISTNGIINDNALQPK